MEKEQSVLDTVFEEENFDDVEMLDVEEGELLEQDPEVENGDKNSGADVKVVNAECDTDNPGQRKNKKKKKKNKRKKSNPGPNVTNVNRFVPDVCRHLKERKSYLVWAAVGCLGVSALSDLVKESYFLEACGRIVLSEAGVDAILACGGQKTSDGKRFRSGGGILWNILKVRDPKAYKEIMKRGKEFEKQFKPHNILQEPMQNIASSSQKITCAPKDQTTAGASDGLQKDSHVQNHLKQSNCEEKQVSVHDRVRIPVAYDDLPGDE